MSAFAKPLIVQTRNLLQRIIALQPVSNRSFREEFAPARMVSLTVRVWSFSKESEEEIPSERSQCRPSNCSLVTDR